MIFRRVIFAALPAAGFRGGAAVVLRIEDGAPPRVDNERAALGCATAPGSA